MKTPGRRRCSPVMKTTTDVGQSRRCSQKPNYRSPVQGLERQGLRRHLPSRSLCVQSYEMEIPSLVAMLQHAPPTTPCVGGCARSHSLRYRVRFVAPRPRRVRFRHHRGSRYHILSLDHAPSSPASQRRALAYRHPPPPELRLHLHAWLRR
jgi:hypothetical protein